jgi:hypothetical protein
MEKKLEHGEMEHEFIFTDITDKGDEVIKTYSCKCGARKIESFWLMKESIAPGKEKGNA